MGATQPDFQFPTAVNFSHLCCVSKELPRNKSKRLQNLALHIVVRGKATQASSSSLFLSH